MAYSYYDANWTVLQKLQYLQELVQTNCADVSSVSITSEQSGTTVTVTISFANYEGTTVTHTITYEVAEPEDPEDPDYITTISVTDDGTLLFTFDSGKTITADGQVVPTVSVGTVTTGDTAEVTNSGTSLNAVFDFVLPYTSVEQEITANSVNNVISGTYGITTDTSEDGTSVEIHLDNPRKVVHLKTVKTFGDYMKEGLTETLSIAGSSTGYVFSGEVYIVVDADNTNFDSGSFYLSDIASAVTDGTILNYWFVDPCRYWLITNGGTAYQYAVNPFATHTVYDGSFMFWVNTSSASSSSSSGITTPPSASYDDEIALSPVEVYMIGENN